jgi:hypothetical protein
MDEQGVNTEKLRAFAAKLEYFAAALDDEERGWLLEVVTAASITRPGEVQGYMGGNLLGMLVYAGNLGGNAASMRQQADARQQAQFGLAQQAAAEARSGSLFNFASWLGVDGGACNV